MPFFHRLVLDFASVSAFSFQPSAIAQVPASLPDGLRWRMIGPFRGGRTVAAVGVPTTQAVRASGTLETALAAALRRVATLKR